MTDKPQLSPSTLTNVGYEAQTDFGDCIDKCFQVSERLQELVERRFDIQLGIREVHIGEQRATHFVNTLNMEQYTEGPDTGALLIDGSIRQFSIENANQGHVEVGLEPAAKLPKVALYQPQTEERLHWYTHPNDPEILGELTLNTSPQSKK